MRPWLPFFLVAMLPLQVSAQRFDLERLQRDASRHRASAALQAHLANEERRGLEPCIKDARWKLKRAEDFFAAVRVAFGNRNEMTYLVFATTYCPGYFGNGPAPYWIVQEDSGQFRTLHFSTTEVVRICKSISSGFRDIEEVSHAPMPEGESVIPLRYDGTKYESRPLGRCSK